MPVRSFSSQLPNAQTAIRNIDNDAPAGLRHEFVDLVFSIYEQNLPQNVRYIYQIIAQTIGIQPVSNPSAGYRHASSRELSQADWPRVYDLICRLWSDVSAIPLNHVSTLMDQYRTGVNQILAAYGIAWDLDQSGVLRRVLPVAVSVQLDAAFQELSDPRFATALSSFHDGMDAYNDRPQRGRDACKNMFDSLESVAKEIYTMPTATFGQVLNAARANQSMWTETISILDKLYQMANSHFRHGMTTPFTLKPAEVDFVVVTCLAGLLLFLRL